MDMYNATYRRYGERIIRKRRKLFNNYLDSLNKQQPSA
jgi:hypothetical protein